MLIQAICMFVFYVFVFLRWLCVHVFRCVSLMCIRFWPTGPPWENLTGQPCCFMLCSGVWTKSQDPGLKLTWKQIDYQNLKVETLLTAKPFLSKGMYYPLWPIHTMGNLACQKLGETGQICQKKSKNKKGLSWNRFKLSFKL